MLDTKGGKFKPVISLREGTDANLNPKPVISLHEGTDARLNPKPVISLREGTDGSIQVSGAREEAVFSYDEMLNCLERGSVCGCGSGCRC